MSDEPKMTDDELAEIEDRTDFLRKILSASAGVDEEGQAAKTAWERVAADQLRLIDEVNRLRQPAVKDDRIVYIAVRYRGGGALVEGGYNTDFDWLDNDKKRVTLQMAMEALIANSVAMFPDDEEMKEFLETQTHLGSAGGPTWGIEPRSPASEAPFKGGARGNDHQAAGDHRAGESTGTDSGDRTD